MSFFIKKLEKALSHCFNKNQCQILLVLDMLFNTSEWLLYKKRLNVTCHHRYLPLLILWKFCNACMLFHFHIDSMQEFAAVHGGLFSDWLLKNTARLMSWPSAVDFTKQLYDAGTATYFHIFDIFLATFFIDKSFVSSNKLFWILLFDYSTPYSTLWKALAWFIMKWKPKT